MAPRTAQPGSEPCEQSENRHSAASSSMSANARDTSAAVPQKPAVRTPGVSIATPTPSSTTSCAVGRGVAAGAAALHLAGGEQLLAGEAVDERRLARARLAQQHEGAAADQGHELVDAVARARR